jgi:hypothetical protein
MSANDSKDASTKAKMRVVIEREDLKDKMVRAGEFIGTKTYDGMSTVQQALLIAQINVMDSYHEILRLRLQHWTD